MVRRALQGCTISTFGRNPAWDNDKHSKLNKWLGHLSGRLVHKFGEGVTHLVVSQRRWTEDPKPGVLIHALEEKANGRDLKIVTFDWLEDCLNSQSRKREAPYEWERRDAEAAKITAKKQKAADKEEKAKAKSVPGIMSEVFHESTEQYVDPEEKERLDRQLARERELAKEREQAEKEERIKRRREQAKIFGRGAKKARNELLSDNYHIFQDSTGFKYDVLVTKIDVRANRNERWAITLQLYESNNEPYVFATNTQFSGTSVASANTLVTAIGTNFPTAMYAFKSQFRDLTGTEWDERISGHIKRLRQDKIDCGQGTGSAAGGSVNGRPVSESAVQTPPFADRKFAYHPPGYGPKGDVTDEERARLKEMGVMVVDGASLKPRAPAVVPEQDIERSIKDAVEEWIHGADVSAAPPATVQAPPAAGADIDFDVMVEEASGGGAANRAENGDGNGDVSGGAAEIESYLDVEYPFEKQINHAEQDDAQLKLNAVGAETSQQELVRQPTENIADACQIEQSQAADPFDWDGLALDMAGDQAWLDNEFAKMQQNQPPHHDSSMQPQIPSFTTHPTTSGSTGFRHCTQEIGETQVAEKAGGEFLEEFGGEQQPTPPASLKKAQDGEGMRDGGSASSKGWKGLGGKVLGGLNLGSSILEKRKAAPASGDGDEDVRKAARFAEDGV